MANGDHFSPPVPTIVDHYSLVNNEYVSRDYKSLRVMRPEFSESCDIRLDLLRGFDAKTYKNDSPPRWALYRLFENAGLSRYNSVRGKDGRPIPFDFVTSRSLLHHISLTPYTPYDAAMVAQKIKGTIHLNVVYAKNLIYATVAPEKQKTDTASASKGRETDEENVDRDLITDTSSKCDGEETDEKNVDIDQLKFMYGGEYFEETATQPYSCAQRNDATGVGEGRDHFYCVFSNRIGPFSVLYSGEMDALKNKLCDTHEPRNYIELKTKNKMLLDSRTHPDKMKRFMRQLWAQCVLSGIEEAIVGYRDDDMICRKIVKYRVNDLPRDFNFDPNISMAAVQNILHLAHSLTQYKRDGELVYISFESLRRHTEDYDAFTILDDQLRRLLL